MATKANTKTNTKNDKVVKPTTISFDEVLHQQTVEYWKVASCWNGRSSEKISFGEACDRLNNILDACNPIRPLAFRINILKFDMVEMGTKKKRKAANENPKPRLTVL